MQPSLHLLVTLLLLSASCRMTPRPDGETSAPARGTAPQFPRLQESEEQIAVELDGQSILRYSLRPFRLHSAQIGATVLRTAATTSRFLMGKDEGATATVTAWTRTADAVDFEMDLHAGPEQRSDVDSAEVRRLVETVSPVTCGDARGYQRSVHQNPRVDPLRGGREWPPAVWFGPHELQSSKPATILIRDHYGHSTVAAPGITYEVQTLALPNGSQVWTLRSFHHVLNQATNPGIDPRLVETVLVAGPTSRLTLSDLLAELVEHPRDRSALLQKYAPARLEHEGGAPPKD